LFVAGLNHSNDAAAALVQDGRVVRACAEERFSRRKHDSSFPALALEFALAGADGGLDGCEAVAFFWNPILHMDAAHRRFTSTPRSHLEFLYSLPTHLLAGGDHSAVPYAELSVPRPGGKPLRLFFVSHHLCHAAHAFFEAPFDNAAIVTIDGYGERTSTLIARGRGTEIETLSSVPFPHSIGSVYAALTEYLGFRANSGEGKVMGLASYGRPRYREVFEKMLRPTSDGFEVELSYFSYMMDTRARYTERLVAALGPARDPAEPIVERHEDIAASLQAVVEDLMVHLARVARERTGCKNLCMAGGVVLNCVANTRVANEAGFERCFFQPACHDAGTSAGAALYVSHCLLGQTRNPPAVKTDYLGPSFSADELRAELDESGLAYAELTDPAEHAAERLTRNRFLGRFDGQAEFGPRALGNRSIVAPPGPEAVKDALNARVKFREPFRPFAPSIPEGSCARFFDQDTPSPFMLRVYQTLPEHTEALGAITHVDGSARVQTVSAEQNPGYLALIEAYGKKSGVDCVLNTSFNIRGEPIVQTPKDAIKCFASTGLHDLYLGPFHVGK
jgi:carbamoyltransferase